MTDWSETEDRTAREMWAARESMSRIAKVLGKSRNAVGGYLFRKHLQRRDPSQRLTSRHRMDKDNKQRRDKRVREKRMRDNPGKPPRPPTTLKEQRHAAVIDKRAAREALIWGSPTTPDAVHAPVPLIDRDSNGCTYPYGHSNFTFCNAPCLDGMAYCVTHARLMYAAPRARQ